MRTSHKESTAIARAVLSCWVGSVRGNAVGSCMTWHVDNHTGHLMAFAGNISTFTKAHCKILVRKFRKCTSYNKDTWMCTLVHRMN